MIVRARGPGNLLWESVSPRHDRQLNNMAAYARPEQGFQHYYSREMAFSTYVLSNTFHTLSPA